MTIMIAITALTQSTTRAIVLQASDKSRLMENTARISRTKTLDGGVSVTHSGYADGDRTLRIRGQVTQDEADVLDDIHRNETFVRVAFFDGVFIAAMDRLNTDNGELDMSMIIKEREV